MLLKQENVLSQISVLVLYYAATSQLGLILRYEYYFGVYFLILCFVAAKSTRYFV